MSGGVDVPGTAGREEVLDPVGSGGKPTSILAITDRA